MTIVIAGIAGSLRKDSLNRRLLAAAAGLLPPGAGLVMWDHLGEVPPFSEDAEAGPAPAAVAGLRAAIARAGGLLVATPEYNGSVPGVLKNAVGWASRPHRASVLASKPAAVISASPTPYGAAWAQADLCKILGIAGADVLEAGLAVPDAPAQFTPAGELADPALAGELAGVLADLAARAAPSAAQAA